MARRSKTPPYDWLKQQTLINYNDVLGISDYSGYNCISKHGVSLTAMFTKDENSFYQQRQFPDPQDPETYTKHDLSFKFQEFNWKLNRLDCHPFKFQRNTPETHVSEAGDILEEYGNRITNSPKRLSSDGITKTYIDPNGNIIIKGQMPLTEEFDNTSFVIKPPKVKLQGSLVSQSISKSHSYLIYERISDLSQNPSKFVNTAWHVSDNLELVKEYNIPAGPWIYNLGYRSCFSCGCECYDAMDLKLSGDSIFALISGKGVRQKHKGVYRLNQDETWEHILQGADTRAFAINENQCLIATGGHSPKVTDICSPKP